MPKDDSAVRIRNSKVFGLPDYFLADFVFNHFLFYHLLPNRSSATSLKKPGRAAIFFHPLFDISVTKPLLTLYPNFILRYIKVVQSVTLE